MRVRCHGLEHLPGAGGVLLAVSHVSHLDPVVVSEQVGRRIGWMSRGEFFRHGLMRPVLRWLGAFPVLRGAYARPTLRESLRRLNDGEIVGIFPEGEIMQGAESVMRGGRIRQGVCWLALRAGCPIIPIVVLGTERLNQVKVWLPLKQGRLYMMVGAAISAGSASSGRKERKALAAQLEAAFRQIYAELRTVESLPESILP